jgi:OPA family glycerol-3-phosphate transporter-like MFS transporter
VINFIVLIGIIAVVALFTYVSGNPRGHSPTYLRRRILNWVPLGIAYAFLYFGRYNLTVAKKNLGDLLMSKSEFGTIFAAGTLVYGCAFLLNGPLTDRIGGRKAMIISTVGAACANLLLGVLVLLLGPTEGPWNATAAHLRSAPGHTLLYALFIVLYSINMYFQSFGAVSIVKVNSAWFHVRERGVFGGIFGILISAGIFFAFDFGQWFVDTFHSTRSAAGALVVNPPFAIFWAPGVLLLLAALWTFLQVHDRPGQAGFADFDTGDASSGEDERPDPLAVVLKKVVLNPIVLTIGAIEFCTGVLRQGIMHWYSIYGKEIGYDTTFFVTKHWGLMMFLAGATGGMTAGWISDKVFGSRRGPVAALLYGLMIIATVAMSIFVEQPHAKGGYSPAGMWVLGVCVMLISYCVIGTHGMLSGTATQDFGGRKNAGIAVGLIDGLVYLGTALQGVSLGHITEKSWRWWPPFLVPFAVIGALLAIRIWHAIPDAARRKG